MQLSYGVRKFYIRCFVYLKKESGSLRNNIESAQYCSDRHVLHGYRSYNTVLARYRHTVLCKGINNLFDNTSGFQSDTTNQNRNNIYRTATMGSNQGSMPPYTCSPDIKGTRISEKYIYRWHIILYVDGNIIPIYVFGPPNDICRYRRHIVSNIKEYRKGSWRQTFLEIIKFLHYCFPTMKLLDRYIYKQYYVYAFEAVDSLVRFAWI